MKEMKVDPIRQGTVIDHIAPGVGLQVVEILALEDSGQEVMIGLNLSSGKLGKKDIVKIENRELNKAELDSIALISPDATYSIIENYDVVRKSLVELPHMINRFIACPNPMCITTVEGVESRFIVENGDTVKVRCVFCEHTYEVSDVRIEMGITAIRT